MAIDTHQDRAGVVSHGRPWKRPRFIPDSTTLSQADRQQVANTYSGIAVGIVVEGADSGLPFFFIPAKQFLEPNLLCPGNKPTGFVEINPYHSNAEGCIARFLIRGSEVTELINPGDVEHSAGIQDENLSFNGTSEYVALESHPSYDLTSDYTVLCRFKRGTDTGGVERIFSITSTDGTTYEQYIQVNASDVLEVGHRGHTSLTGTETITPGEWYWIGVSYQTSNGRMRLRIDGDQDVGVIDTVDANATTGEIQIGRRRETSTWNYGFDGEVSDLLFYNTVLGKFEQQQIAADPYGELEPVGPYWYGMPRVAAYVMVAEQGSYILTGQDANLIAGRQLIAEQGSYVLTGQDAGLIASRNIVAEQGSYTLTGQDAVLRRAFTLVAEQGSYTLNGQAAELVASRKLAAEQGSYTLSGQDADLTRGYHLVAEQGSYTLTGQDANLILSRVLTAEQGSYTLTGYAAALRYSGAPFAEEMTEVTVVLQDRTLTFAVLPNEPIFDIESPDTTH